LWFSCRICLRDCSVLKRSLGWKPKKHQKQKFFGKGKQCGSRTWLFTPNTNHSKPEFLLNYLNQTPNLPKPDVHLNYLNWTTTLMKPVVRLYAMWKFSSFFTDKKWNSFLSSPTGNTSIIKTSHLILFREIIGVCCENHTWWASSWVL